MAGAAMPPNVAWPDPARLSKSGVRVLEILEWFSDTRRPAIAQEIAQVLELPISSASDLLKSLVETGHLLFNKDDKTYYPSPRVLRLSLSLLPNELDSAGLLGILRDLRARTGECVAINSLNGHQMQFLSILPSPSVVQEQDLAGLKYPLIGSASGSAILATKRDFEIIEIVKKATVPCSSRERAEAIQTTLESARLARKRGYAVSYLDQWPSAMSVAVTLPEQESRYPLALCIGGRKADLRGREEYLANLMRQTISEHLLGRSAST
jgi:DNA-binding IclR family transcriptional regulator